MKINKNIFLSFLLFINIVAAKEVPQKKIITTKKEKTEIDYELSNFIFGIFSALGSIGTVGAFIFLFRRDKDKQSQIDKLTGIASILEAQNETMKSQNDLMAQQVDVLRNTSILQVQDNEAMLRLKEIEEKKLKLSVKPNLWLNGVGYNVTDGQFQIDLNNKGEDAKLLDFVLNSNDVILHNEHLPWNLEKGERRYIFGQKIGEKHIKDMEYEIDVIYEDKLENKYSIKIKGVGSVAKITEVNEI